MKNLYLHNKAFLDKIVLATVALSLMFATIFFASFISPFVIGYVISLILSPIVDYIERKFGINRGLVTTVIIVLGLGLLVLIITLVVGRLVAEMTAFLSYVTSYTESLQNVVQEVRERILLAFGGTGIYIDFDAVFAGVITFATGLLQGFIEGGNFITAIPSTIFRIILTIISAFFFIKDKEMIKSSILQILPDGLVMRGREMRKSLLNALAGYAKGQMVIMCIVGTICIIGLTVLGSPYSLFIGLGIALFDVIPVLGSGAILLPWAVYSFITGNTMMGVGLLIIWALSFLSRQILEPKIVGKRIGLHPLVLLASIYAGITIIGPAGFFAGPLIALVVKLVVKQNAG